MIEQHFPLKSAIFFLFNLVISSPLYFTEPPVMAPFSARICMIEYAVTDFPEPDSPTIPRVFPGSSLKLTPFTADTSPLSVLKVVCRSDTSRTNLLSSILLTPYYFDNLGANASLKPSPIRFNVRTMIQIVSAGKIRRNG